VKALHWLQRTALAAAFLAGAAAAAAAQTPPVLVRGDLAGSFGWLSAKTAIDPPGAGTDWHSSLFGAASGGWYWTDNFKTEIDAGAGTRATAYHYRAIIIDGRPGYLASETTFSRRTAGISQQYQFFRNAWFHPHIAAGANLTWERATEHFQPVVALDSVSSRRVLVPESTDGPHTVLTIRPFVATGFKAYMTRCVFFRSDLRVAFHAGVDEALLRFGFGVDF
jgi:hypothetical protein